MRLFIGLSIPNEIKRIIKSNSDTLENISPGKYVREDMYHITLAYIGESDETMRLRAEDAARNCAAKISTFDVRSSGIDYFGKREKAILHYAVRPSFELLRLSDMLRSCLTDALLPYDAKPFCPHITLARNVNAVQALLNASCGEFGFKVEDITLFNSCRINGELSYVPIAAFPLKGNIHES